MAALVAAIHAATTLKAKKMSGSSPLHLPRVSQGLGVDSCDKRA